jgi:hypothetical protein
MSNHLLIGGTGRAGTSFLVRLLHELGLETHLSREGGERDWSEQANAGLEDMLQTGGASPYVVKSPWLFEWIDPLLESDFVIDGVILPMRELTDAAASRSILEYQHMHQVNPNLANQEATWDSWGAVAGGIVYSTHPLDQARLLATGFFKVVQRLTEAAIPMYFAAFPRLIADPEYLYDQINPCLPRPVAREDFIAAHGRVADPSKVRVGPTPATTPIEAENLALKREIGRLRAEIAAERAEIAAERRRLEAAHAEPSNDESLSVRRTVWRRLRGA